MDRTGLSRVTQVCGRQTEMKADAWSESGQDWTFQSHRGLWETDRDEGSGSESGQDWTFQSHRGLWKTQTEMKAATWSDGGQGWTFQSHRRLWKTDRGGGRCMVREWTRLDFPESQRAVEDTDRDGHSWSESGQDWTFQSHRGLWKTQTEMDTAGQMVDRTGLS